MKITCPDCLEAGKRRSLAIFERNYSGLGVDMAECCECGHIFQISYKIDKLKRCEGWEIDD